MNLKNNNILEFTELTGFLLSECTKYSKEFKQNNFHYFTLLFVTENVDDNTFMIQFISVNEILNFKGEHEHQNIHEVITTYYEYVNNFYNCNFKDSY